MLNYQIGYSSGFVSFGYPEAKENRLPDLELVICHCADLDGESRRSARMIAHGGPGANAGPVVMWSLKSPGGKTPADDIALDVIGVVADRNVSSAGEVNPGSVGEPKEGLLLDLG